MPYAEFIDSDVYHSFTSRDQQALWCLDLQKHVAPTIVETPSPGRRPCAACDATMRIAARKRFPQAARAADTTYREKLATTYRHQATGERPRPPGRSRRHHYVAEVGEDLPS